MSHTIEGRWIPVTVCGECGLGLSEHFGGNLDGTLSCPRSRLEGVKAPSEPSAIPKNAGLYSDEPATGPVCVGCGASATMRCGARYGDGPEGSELFPVCDDCARVLP